MAVFGIDWQQSTNVNLGGLSLSSQYLTGMLKILRIRMVRSVGVFSILSELGFVRNGVSASCHTLYFDVTSAACCIAIVEFIVDPVDSITAHIISTMYCIYSTHEQIKIEKQILRRRAKQSTVNRASVLNMY